VSSLYDGTIDLEARNTGLPFALIKGMVEVESAFNPKAFRREVAINDASRGLMQLLFRTAKMIEPNLSPDDLFDPSLNIRIGAEYLRRQIARYGGKRWHGVSAYNAGTARIATAPTTICLARDQVTGRCIHQWTAQPGDFLNQPYVDKVKTAMAKYSFDDVGSGSSSGEL
jgi:soluble lytic murein transglycosylase-like protein